MADATVLTATGAAAWISWSLMDQTRNLTHATRAVTWYFDTVGVSSIAWFWYIPMHALITVLTAVGVYCVLTGRTTLRAAATGALGACLVALCAPICGRLLGYAIFPALATPLVLWRLEQRT